MTDFSGSLGNIDIGIYNTPTLATTVANYPINGTTNAGAGEFYYYATGGGANYCQAAAGDVDVESYGAVGSNITGTVTITDWTSESAGFCDSEIPTPATAEFSITRAANERPFLHSGQDTFSGTRTGGGGNFAGTTFEFTESSATPYDPVVHAENSGGNNYLEVTILATLSGDETTLRRKFNLQFYNGGGIGVGSYPLTDSNNSFEEEFDGASCFHDFTDVESFMTIDTYNVSTGLVVGTFDLTSAGGTDCPTSWSGDFSITK